jgi:phosphoglycolate phosphatase-like HAD superfamily hydrolase
MRALLWDIDGTLTKGSGAGAKAVGAALEEMPEAKRAVDGMRFDGMTDPAILRKLLAVQLEYLVNYPPGQRVGLLQRTREQAVALAAMTPEERLADVREDELAAALAGYLVELERICGEGAYQQHPGIGALIPLLDRHHVEEEGEAHPLRAHGHHERVVLGLATGNLEKGAQLKLQSVGLHQHFRFGGYADDGEDRVEIVRAAWRRAQALGATEAVVIDDAVKGVLAARAVGLPVVGVCTGRRDAAFDPVRELAAAGADFVVPDFSDAERSLALLLGPLPAVRRP